MDQSAEGENIVTCDKSLKDEAEALLSQFGIYLKVVFGFVVWDTFTKSYQLSMEEFQYCLLRKFTTEITAAMGASVTSTIATDDSATSIDRYITP